MPEPLVFDASTEIDAPPQSVWAVLLDVARWPQWDSGVESVDGTIRPGGRIVIKSAVAPGRPFPVRVSTLSAPSLLQFTGGMPLGLFKGVRDYTLQAAGAGTAFRMREVYSGPMLGMIRRSIPDLGPSFTRFVTGLKAEVERRG